MIFEFLSAMSVASPPSPTWKCEGCTPEEKITLAYIQERTNITDRNALATIMGNIKQESQFKSNICEGGARVPYKESYSVTHNLSIIYLRFRKKIRKPYYRK